MRTATTRTNRFVFASLGCLLALLIVIGTACRKQETPTTGTSEPNATSSQQTPSGDLSGTAAEPETIAVTVNGEPITEAQVDARVDFYLRNNQQAAMLPAELTNQLRPMIRTQMLDALIGQLLLTQEAKNSGVTVSDDEVMAALGERAAAQNPPLTVDQLKQMFEAQGGDFNDVITDFREGLTLDKFMAEKLEGQTEVTEQDARDYYNEHITDFNQPEVVQASHILLGYTDTDPNADHSADPNKAKAEELLAQIKAGADFGELAMANSIDTTSKVRGGQLGYFTHGDMVPVFEEAAFALEPNGVSDIVESQFGYHIIKVTDHRAAGIVPFEEAQSFVTARVKEEKQTTFVSDYLETLKEKATIEYPAADEPEASEPNMTAFSPAPIARTPRASEPNAGEGGVIVVDPNLN